MKSIDEHLKEYRKEHHLAQKQMAGKLGVSREYYAQIEEGKVVPSLPVQNSIAVLLDIFIFYCMPLGSPVVQKFVQAVGKEMEKDEKKEKRIKTTKIN